MANLPLREGMEAPDFTLRSHRGETVRLSSLLGRKVVLYFYPKDDTPGCTKEACAFRDSFGEVTEAGAVILGVSRDDETSHRRFAEKYGLNFLLLSDPDAQICRAYGVWAKRSLYGRNFLGIIRATFVIDPAGRIAAIYPKVKVENHAQEVLATLQKMPDLDLVGRAKGRA
ncbi:MAG: thioredoxin-dependent thiol peroxidase [Candidatus Omnitrophica bacterium]|nr:thioredoxin-dependent thiol peroxidase [Candidatus Omnitrophota bacterium]